MPPSLNIKLYNHLFFQSACGKNVVPTKLFWEKVKKHTIDHLVREHTMAEEVLMIITGNKGYSKVISCIKLITDGQQK